MYGLCSLLLHFPITLYCLILITLIFFFFLVHLMLFKFVTPGIFFVCLFFPYSSIVVEKIGGKRLEMKFKLNDLCKALL